MNKLSLVVLSLIVLPVSAMAIPFGGVEFPQGAASFADVIVSYTEGTGVGDTVDDPSEAIGTPDGGYVSLGNDGILVVQFTDNSLTTSGDTSLDLWIFEIAVVENTAVAISTNGTDWISVGTVAGATSGIDIDAYIAPGEVVLGEKYSFVKLTDILPNSTGFPTAGADIDAIGAISSAAPVPQPGIPEPATVGLVIGGLAAARRFRK